MKKFGYELGVNFSPIFDTDTITYYESECLTRHGYLNLFNCSRAINELLNIFEICDRVNSDVIIGEFVSDNIVFENNSKIKYKDGYFAIYEPSSKYTILQYLRIDKKSGKIIFSWFYNLREIINIFENRLEFKENKFHLEDNDIKNIINHDWIAAPANIKMSIENFKLYLLKAIRFQFVIRDVENFYKEFLNK